MNVMQQPDNPDPSEAEVREACAAIQREWPPGEAVTRKYPDHMGAEYCFLAVVLGSPPKRARTLFLSPDYCEKPSVTVRRCRLLLSPAVEVEQ